MNKTATASFAATAAALFLGACAGSQGSADTAANASGETVKCLGINSCKGESKCSVSGAHGCSGQNECSGKGWIEVPKADCDAKGGTVL